MFSYIWDGRLWLLIPLKKKCNFFDSVELRSGIFRITLDSKKKQILNTYWWRSKYIWDHALWFSTSHIWSHFVLFLRNMLFTKEQNKSQNSKNFKLYFFMWLLEVIIILKKYFAKKCMASIASPNPQKFECVSSAKSSVQIPESSSRHRDGVAISIRWVTISMFLQSIA